MRQIKIYDYYSFGYNYHILLNSSRGNSNLKVYQDLKTYLDVVENLNLTVTMASMKILGLSNELTSLEKLSKQSKSKNLPIDESLLERLETKLKKIDFTIDAELDTKDAFILEEKRISLNILLNEITKLFSVNCYDKLPEVAKFDFEESGKCLAFDRYTAAAFHALRGTEGTLKYYYSVLLTKVPKDSQTWYNFVTEIEKEIKLKKIIPAPNGDLMTNLDSLRKYYRNKTQHPQLIYSSDDVQDLLTNCIKTVNQIIKDLQERSLI